MPLGDEANSLNTEPDSMPVDQQKLGVSIQSNIPPPPLWNAFENSAAENSVPSSPHSPHLEDCLKMVTCWIFDAPLESVEIFSI